jgi:hypothetical protein
MNSFISLLALPRIFMVTKGSSASCYEPLTVPNIFKDS